MLKFLTFRCIGRKYSRVVKKCIRDNEKVVEYIFNSHFLVGTTGFINLCVETWIHVVFILITLSVNKLNCMIITYLVLPNTERKKFNIKLFTSVYIYIYKRLTVRLNVLNTAKNKYHIKSTEKCVYKVYNFWHIKPFKICIHCSY